jgi:hypothetical protein
MVSTAVGAVFRSSTDALMTPPSSKVAPEAARKLAMLLLRLGQVSNLFEAFSRLEQVARQVRVREVGAEPLDEARTVEDRSTGLPKRAALTRAFLCLAVRGETERARVGLDLTHAPNLSRGLQGGIRLRTDRLAALY